MNKLTGPEKHFSSKDIQSHVRGYIGCPAITNNGQDCRSSLATNRFIDPITNKKFNCNWYCLRNCSPEKLMPIFNNLPKYALFRDGTRISIDDISFTFITPTEHIHINISGGSWEWDDLKYVGTQYPQYLTQIGFMRESYQFAELADQLCKWFKRQNPTVKIGVKCVIPSNDINDQLEFIGFDKPFFRPVSKWTNDGESIFTKLMVLNKPELRLDEQKHDMADDLPVDLAEEPEVIHRRTPLSSRGVAHPNLHRVPRRHRPESHHRPRHFHSPANRKKSGRK